MDPLQSPESFQCSRCGNISSSYHAHKCHFASCKEDAVGNQTKLLHHNTTNPASKKRQHDKAHSSESSSSSSAIDSSSEDNSISTSSSTSSTSKVAVVGQEGKSVQGKAQAVPTTKPGLSTLCRNFPLKGAPNGKQVLHSNGHDDEVSLGGAHRDEADDDYSSQHSSSAESDSGSLNKSRQCWLIDDSNANVEWDTDPLLDIAEEKNDSSSSDGSSSSSSHVHQKHTGQMDATESDHHNGSNAFDSTSSNNNNSPEVHMSIPQVISIIKEENPGTQIEYCLLEQQQQRIEDGHVTHPMGRTRLAELKLACILNKSSIPLSTFDLIIKWVKEDCPKDPQHLKSRKSLMKYLIKRYDDRNAPIKKEVRLQTGQRQVIVHSKKKRKITNTATTSTLPPTVPPRTACIIIHNLMQQIFQILSNPAVCNDETLLFPGLFPGAPLPNKVTVVDDVDTGEQFRLAHKKYCKGPRDVLVPFLCADDKASTDKHGKLALEPYMTTLGIIKRQYRELLSAWRVVGYMFNQSLQQFKHSENGLQDYHDVLTEILREMQTIEAGPGVAWVFHYKGTSYPVILHFCLLYIIGDTPGHDRLCCRYQSYSIKTKCLCRYCNVATKDTDNPYAKWTLTKQNDIQKLVRELNEDALQSVSYKCVEHAFARLGFTFGGGSRKIHGALPAELLHLLQLGLMVRIVNEFYCIKLLTKKGKGKEASRRQTAATFNRNDAIDETGGHYFFNQNSVESYEELSKKVGLALAQQSDRDLPRTHFPQGIIPSDLDTCRKGQGKTGKKSGSEVQGMIILNLFMLVSYYGDYFAEACGQGQGNDFVAIFEMMLLLEQFMKKQDGYRKSHLATAQEIIKVIQVKITKVCDRTGNGWKIPKFHLLCHFISDMYRFGASENWNSRIPESLHKFMTTGAGRRTQRRTGTFEKQTADRNRELQLLGRAAEEIGLQEENNKMQLDDSDDMDHGMNEVERCELLARYKSKEDAFFRPRSNNTHDRFLDYLDDSVFTVVQSIVKTLKLEHVDIISMIKRQDPNGGDDIIYRANPIQNRHDWCLVDWAREGCIESQIQLFVDLRGCKIDTTIAVNGGNIDSPGIYAVGYCISEPLDWDDTTQFRSTNESRLVKLASPITGPVAAGSQEQGAPIPYLWNVSSIQGPCVAIPNLNQTGFLNDNRYLFLMPRKLWANRFLKLYEEMEDIDEEDSPVI